jgi:NAD/NADP transhydrogenase beta subunit
MVPLLDIIPLSVLNKSYRSKNRSASFTAVIIVIIVKYPENFIYLLIITRIALVTSLVLILVGGKPIIKSIINSNIGPYRIGSTNNSLYRRCLDIYTL